MSQENVQIIRHAVTASQRADWQAAISFYDAQVELDESRMVDGGVFHGHDGVWAFFRRWFGTWDVLQITPAQFVDVDDERVVLILELMGKGKGSGVEVSMRSGDVYTLRDKKIARMVGYPDHADAVKAVGPEE